MQLNRRTSILHIGAALAATAGPALAQTYPVKTIRFIAPFPPGGYTDLFTRMVAQGLSQELGQTVFVDNRAGAGGAVGAREISRAEPDGYTVGLATISTHGFNPAVNRAIGYDVTSDFTPISRLGSFGGVIMLRPNFPAKDFAGFIKEVKASPGKYSYASSGIGGAAHIAMELFKSKTGLFITHIPYRGAAQGLQDTMAGTVDMIWDALPHNVPLIKSGKLIAIGVVATSRSSLLPDVPTFTELGVRDYEPEMWNGLVGPPKMPAPIVATLNAALHRYFKQPEAVAKFRDIGTDVRVGTPDNFGRFMRSEVERWSSVARAAKISVE